MADMVEDMEDGEEDMAEEEVIIQATITQDTDMEDMATHMAMVIMDADDCIFPSSMLRLINPL